MFNRVCNPHSSIQAVLAKMLLEGEKSTNDGLSLIAKIAHMVPECLAVSQTAICALILDKKFLLEAQSKTRR